MHSSECDSFEKVELINKMNIKMRIICKSIYLERDLHIAVYIRVCIRMYVEEHGSQRFTSAAKNY